MCDKVQRLIDEANEEKDRIIEEQRKALERQESEYEKSTLAQAAEIARLKSQLAAIFSHIYFDS